ncbi:MAG: biotin-dependent carboxyltransferase family protein [Bacteroidia bacterium]|nr:biotin-dependent carboxyltransferase family protein [Bacteroidia bacterium]
MINVVQPGFFTTIQDMGRFGLRHFGVPVSGCMDRDSARKANLLLENDPSDALLEITMTGPELIFQLATYITITGAHFPATVNSVEIPLNTVVKIEAEDRLQFGKLQSGFRTYLAVKGGIQTEEILNSRSYYKPITVQNRLKKGQELQCEAWPDFDPRLSSYQVEKETTANLLAFPGPEFDMLQAEQTTQLWNSEFTVAKENNRMAYQLEEGIGKHSKTILTSATLPGTVQYTPAGKLIILMRDAQTTGGYPRILQIREKSLNKLAQLKTGDRFRFKKQAYEV